MSQSSTRWKQHYDKCFKCSLLTKLTPEQLLKSQSFLTLTPVSGLGETVTVSKKRKRTNKVLHDDLRASTTRTQRLSDRKQEVQVLGTQPKGACSYKVQRLLAAF